MNKRTNKHRISITIRVSVQRKVRVRAYKRRRNGRLQLVRGHYRRY